MSRILVTGAAGFLGSHVLARLAHHGHDLVGTARKPFACPVAPIVAADLSDPDAASTLLTGQHFDSIVHCAAFISAGNESSDMENALASNVAATARLASLAAQNDTEKFIFCSTTNIYGNLDPNDTPEAGATEATPSAPNNLYAWSKLASEQHLQLLASTSHMTTQCLRLAGIHGPGRSAGVVHHMAKNALAGLPLHIKEPKSRFTLLFIDDAAEAIERTLNMDMPQGATSRFGVWNVTNDESLSLDQLATQLTTLAASESAVECSDSSRTRFQVYDNRAFKTASGFEPLPVAHRLEECVTHLQDL